MFFQPRKKYKNYPDEELLKLFQENQANEIWEELYERYMPLVYGVCMNILRDKKSSEDTCMYLFELLPDFMIRYNITHFKSWLFTIARNHCYAKRKTSVAFKEIPAEQLEDSIPEEPTDYVEELFSVKLEFLGDCLNSIKEEHRICIQLFYYEQKSYQEIADITHFTLKNVKSFIQNGKRNLKICIEKKR